jgi:tryptophan synthase alpha chain
VLEGSGGFYYVSVAGITGKQSAALASIEDAVARIKQTATIPVPWALACAPRTGRRHCRRGRWVVVGSALVDLVAQHGADAAGPVRELTAALSAAVHAARKELA